MKMAKFSYFRKALASIPLLNRARLRLATVEKRELEVGEKEEGAAGRHRLCRCGREGGRSWEAPTLSVRERMKMGQEEGALCCLQVMVTRVSKLSRLPAARLRMRVR